MAGRAGGSARGLARRLPCGQPSTSTGRDTSTPNPQPSFIIDTPGIKGFGLVDLEEHHIGDQFPEMFKLKGACRFNDCLHKDEPGCAVRKAVEAGDVPESRYRSYLDMLAGVDDENPYRTD